jgi:cytochrome c1
MIRFVAAMAVIAALPLAAAADVSSSNHHAMAKKAAMHKAASKPSNVVSITMPTDVAYDYKPGPGQQVAETYCLTCHSAGYVKMQPPMDSAHWLKTVTKMRQAYGAQFSDAEAQQIADYLGAAYGPPKP